MIEAVIPLVSAYLSTGMLEYALIPIFCGLFLASLPCLIRYLFFGG